MEEKKKGKKAWKIAAGIIGAVLIAAIIYCMAAAMMPLGPGGVRIYYVGDDYKTSAYTLNVKNDGENERFVFTYLAAEGKENEENAFCFDFQNDQSGQESTSGFTCTDEGGEEIALGGEKYVFTGGKTFYVSYAAAGEAKTAIAAGQYSVGNGNVSFLGKKA